MTTNAHQEPTAATVKGLYAHAFRCAKPDCARPLYKQDNETGERTLNSRVAHIHARRRGGPRWIDMPSEDNRDDANLVLLCIEHSYEVDDLPDKYPAELLRLWKQGQLDEYEQAQRGWPLTDTEAGRVLEASAQASEYHYAGAVLDAVRAVERFTLASRRARTEPAAAAAAWRTARARARGTFTAWDQDGNAVYADPSRQETLEHTTALRDALTNVVESIGPLADEAKVELVAVRASRPTIEPWSAWATRAVDEVVAASSTWPGPPALKDDDRLEGALSGLSAATDALASVWRGDQNVPAPPESDPEPNSDSVARDPLAEHRELLDRARPYSRVDHRTYDAELRSELAIAAEEAAAIPPVASAVAIGLSATCRLAAAVAGNADDGELADLVAQDACRRPLSAAVHLLAEMARMSRDRGRPGPRENAESALATLWAAVDWSDPGSWDADDANGHSMFWAGSRVTSPERVKEELSNALGQQPDLVLPVVTACAPWVEMLDSDTWQTRGFRRRYSELPPWFPAEAIAVAVAATSVETHAASVRVDDFGETEEDDSESLLAHVLWLAQRQTSPE